MHTPPGWFPDAHRPGGYRWWDGYQWTHHVWPPLQMEPEPQLRKRPSVAAVVSIVVAASVVLAVGLGAAGYWYVSAVIAGNSRPVPTGPVLISYELRPTWGSLTSRTDDMIVAYSVESAGDLDPERLDEFQLRLQDLRETQEFVATLHGVQTEAMDLLIADFDAALTDLESSLLDGTDFPEFDWDRWGDGVVPRRDQIAWLLEAEGEAAKFAVATTDSGSYIDAASDLALEFGLFLTWENPALYDCGDELRTSDPDVRLLQAYYCTSTPDLIYINSVYMYFPDEYFDAWFIDLIRHEIAHYAIYERCGTLDPGLSLEHGPEAVTNSYAILFLGASRSVLELDAPDEYLTSDITDDIARAIHSGDCSGR